MPKATLINDQGNKVVVEAGSQEAQGYFGSGYKLMGADGRAVPVAAPTATPAPVAIATAPTPRVLERYKLGSEETPAEQTIRTHYENLDREFTPEDEATIRERTRKEMQAELDAIDAATNELLGRAREQGVGRLGQARAIAARSGQLGSPMGEAKRAQTEEYNLGVERSIENEAALKRSAVFGKIDQRANDLIQAEKAAALSNADKYIERLKTLQDEARGDVKVLAQSGLSLDELEDSDYQTLLKQTGYNGFMLEAFYNSNKPAPQKIDYSYKIEGNKLVAYGVDPKTNQLKYLTQDLPEEFKAKVDKFTGFTVTPDGTPLFYNANTGEAQVAPGFKEGQFLKPAAQTGTSGGAIKFSQDDVQRLAAGGLSQAEIKRIQEDVNEFGLDSVLDGLNEAQQKTLKNVMRGVTTTQEEDEEEEGREFLDADFVKRTFGNVGVTQMLDALGKERSEYKKLFSSAGREEEEIKADYDAYLTETVIPMIQSYRDAGYTDKDILTMLQ